jgi:malate synthase
MMFYPNGYMNMDQSGEYTKHYYADALRIASKIGSGFSQNLCDEANQIGDDIDPNYLEDRRDKQYDENKDIAQAFEINSIPFFLFCPVDGQAQATMGMMSEEQMRQAIKDVLKK